MATKKRELEAAADSMTQEERNIWRQKLDALEAEDDKAVRALTALQDKGDIGTV